MSKKKVGVMRRKELLIFTVLIFSVALFLSGCSTLNDSPSANFSVEPEDGKAPLEVTFDGSNSSDPDGEIVNYDWDFGDDSDPVTKESDDPVNHTYESGGDYEAKLTVTDDEGDTDTQEVLIEVSFKNQPPRASFTFTATNDSAPYYVNFDAAQSSDTDGTIESYEWSLGDGSKKTGETCSNTYDHSGDFDITLTVTDDEGASSVASTTLTLSTEPDSNQSPQASFTASPETGQAPLDVSFDASDSSHDGQIVSYSWDFDDGESATGETVSHTFESGDYEVALTVTDDEGATGTVKDTIEVEPENPPMPG